MMPCRVVLSGKKHGGTGIRTQAKYQFWKNYRLKDLKDLGKVTEKIRIYFLVSFHITTVLVVQIHIMDYGARCTRHTEPAT